MPRLKKYDYESQYLHRELERVNYQLDLLKNKRDVLMKLIKRREKL